MTYWELDDPEPDAEQNAWDTLLMFFARAMFAGRFSFLVKRVEWTNVDFLLGRRTWAKKSNEEKTVEINPTVRKRNVLSAPKHIFQTVAWNKTPPNATRHRMQHGDDAKNERRMHTSRNTFDDRAQKCRLEAQRGGEAFPVASDKSDGVWNLSPVRKQLETI